MITRPEVVRRSLVNKVLREENTALRRRLAELRDWAERLWRNAVALCPDCMPGDYCQSHEAARAALARVDKEA